MGVLREEKEMTQKLSVAVKELQDTAEEIRRTADEFIRTKDSGYLVELKYIMQNIPCVLEQIDDEARIFWNDEIQ